MYEHFIIVLEIILTKELTMECDDTLIHEMSKKKERKLKVMMLQWCCVKAHGVIQFHSKTLRRATIATNMTHCIIMEYTFTT